MRTFWPLLAGLPKTIDSDPVSPRGCVRVFGALLLLLAAGGFTPAASAAPACGAAASQGANGPADFATYCWIDFSTYNNTTATSAGGQNFTITLPGGSTLSFNLKASGPTLASTAVPTWTGAALGQSAFITIPGNPALYQTAGAGTTSITISNIVLTVGSGTVPYAIVAADAESTNGGETLSFTTNGNPWTLLASMAYTGSTTFPTLSGTGTATVTETGVNGNVGAYAFATLGSPTTISASLLGSGLQGVAFAVKFHAVDFAIASSHTGSFSTGGTGSYTLTATNNGPDQYAPTDTVTVTDTLPTGETYVSASGTGWTCGAVGQVVTCTVSNVTVNSGSSLPAITVNVNVATNAAASLTNTATVASNPSLDYNTANNTATDVTTIVQPDLSTSTKSVLNPGGGDYNVGDTVQYTITLTESAGAVAASVSMTDNLPANLSGFTASAVTVTGSSSTITNSSTNTGGTNGDGLVSISNITVPANGTVTIVFTALVKTGTANCTNISNTGTITYTDPGTTTVAVTAPTVIVAQSACAASGNKILYVYDNQTLTRVVQTANTTGIAVAEGGTLSWTLSPAFKKAFNLAAGTVTVELMSNASGAAGNNRSYTVSILKNATVLGTSAGTGNFTSTTLTLRTSTVTVPATSFAVGDTLVLRVNNTSTGGTNRTVNIAQKTAVNNSDVIFATSTVINVDSVNAYNAVYPATTTTAVYSPGTTVFICAAISDPFGSADATSAVITLLDPTGTTQVSAAAMTAKGATDCAGTVNAADEAYEYTFAIPSSAATGFWTATVTGNEGTEGSITHTANGAFDVDVPALLIVKSVAVTTDPVEGATRSKAIPGATVQYTIQIQNNGRGSVDSGSLVISDPVPTNTVLSLPAKPPFTFTDGATSSGLSVSANDGSIVYSNNGGTSYVYVPACTRPCTDSAITNFKITLNGAMNGKTGGTAPSFTIIYDVVIQ
jgi:fimbrial isopeptide formation D2 family protein/uncharacterized repeat protein (TIGR01451 family)